MLISVVICAYNEEKRIGKSIEAIQEQDFPKEDFEIVVVNNASTDQTAELAKSYGVRVVYEKEKGIAHARQKGSEEARGEIIAFTDADTHVPNHWLKTIAQAFQKDEKLVGFGGVFRINSGSFMSRLVINHGEYPLYLLAKIITGKWLLVGNNMAYKKSAFEKTGGYNTNLSQGEDTDISQKLNKVGKVKLINNFYVYQSGRRFEQGLIRGLASYGWNWPLKVFFNIDTAKRLPDFR